MQGGTYCSPPHPRAPWGATVVLLDLLMPDVDGFSVLHQLRTQPATHDLPVIVISAIADTFESEEAAKDVQAVFPKPLNIPRFLQTLQYLTYTPLPSPPNFCLRK